MKLIKWIDTSESEILPFVSLEDQSVRDFLDEAYSVIIGERSYGGSCESTSIIDPSTNTNVDSVCQNIRIYVARLHIVAISYPHVSSTTRDAIETVRWFCYDILQDPNIFRHCGESKMLELMSAQRWMMYLDSIRNISRESERIDGYNQWLKSLGDEITSFITIERLQKEIRISENWSAVFEGHYCFIHDWFQRKFWIDFWQAKKIIFSSGDLQYPEELAHIDGLPRTLDDFFQQVIEGVTKYVREFCVWDHWNYLTLREIEEKIENLLGKFWVTAYGAVYDLPETKLILKNTLWLYDLLETYNYFPRSPSF